MSDEARIQKKTILDATGGSLSPTNRSKLTLIEASEQLDSIRKLKSGYLSTEQNNNSIFTQPSNATEHESSSSLNAFKMDSKRKLNLDSGNKLVETSVTTMATTRTSSSSTNADLNPSLEKSNQIQDEPAIPSYSSIFTTPTRRSLSPIRQQQVREPLQQQQRTSTSVRLPLKKQVATDPLDTPVTISRLSGAKKLTAFNYTNEHQNDEDDYEYRDEDDEIDERLPFNTGVSAKFHNSNGHNKRVWPEAHRCGSPNIKNSMLANVYNHRDCEFDLHNNKPHTKISFSESRPPSFHACQSRDNSNRKSEWADKPQSCLKCECNNCFKKQRSAKSEGHIYRNDSQTAKNYSRTKAMHLVLKSIILVLLTILLLMLFIGIIVASHYLPQLFDRMLNASRSFNVTIAG